ncbi:MAG: polysaccharide deacetylase family protein [Ardenticatenaceae bacterium]|nr:polysaccharide deacetylase family protein [Ardenticatenaceae bacterium]
MHAIVTVHDVMPHTMPEVADIIKRLWPFPRPQICLLVVPGRPWTVDQRDQLRRWQESGFELAAHGWLHETERISTLYHQLHSKLISRNVAEHLSLTDQEVCALIRRNHAWWVQNGFEPPQLYVPPAWAMGRVSREQLAALPYRYYETTNGILDARMNVFKWLPLAGFESDNRWRKIALRIFNGLNLQISSPNRPLRLSIHPYDFEYLLGDTIMDWLNGVEKWVNYRQVFN